MLTSNDSDSRLILRRSSPSTVLARKQKGKVMFDQPVGWQKVLFHQSVDCKFSRQEKDAFSPDNVCNPHPFSCNCDQWGEGEPSPGVHQPWVGRPMADQGDGGGVHPLGARLVRKRCQFGATCNHGWQVKHFNSEVYFNLSAFDILETQLLS